MPELSLEAEAQTEGLPHTGWERGHPRAGEAAGGSGAALQGPLRPGHSSAGLPCFPAPKPLLWLMKAADGKRRTPAELSRAARACAHTGSHCWGSGAGSLTGSPPGEVAGWGESAGRRAQQLLSPHRLWVGPLFFQVLGPQGAMSCSSGNRNPN